jgi:DNA-binding NarL/FixJ family response regulator
MFSSLQEYRYFLLTAHLGHHLYARLVPSFELAREESAIESSALTEEEIELLALMSRGLADDDVAARLGWTRSTLRRRLHRAMEKLDARSRFQAGFLFAQVRASGGPP